MSVNADMVSDAEGSTKHLIHGVVFRSAVPRGTIVSAAIPQLPDGYYVIGPQDIPGQNNQSLFGGEMPFLAETAVHYEGEPLLLLAGKERLLLAGLATQIQVDFEKEQPVRGLNDPFEHTRLKILKGDPEAVFRKGFRRVEGEYTTSSPGNPARIPLCVTAVWKNGVLRVHTPSSYPHYTRDCLAKLLAMPAGKIRVSVPARTAGSERDMVYPTLAAGHAALLAMLTRKPVRMEYSWADGGKYCARRLPSRIRHRTALDAAGRLQAVSIDIAMDAGAYSIASPLALERAVLAACGAYACSNLSISAALYYTNRPPFCGSSGLGEPQAFFASEVHAGKIADETGLDPVEWRKANLGAGLFAGGHNSDRSGCLRVLDDVMERSDFRRKFGAYEAAGKGRQQRFSTHTPLKGIGIALCFHGIGMPLDFETRTNTTVKVQLDTNKKVHVITSLPDKFHRSVASSLLSIPPKDVLLEGGGTFLVPDSGPDLGSRASALVGKLVEQSCKSLRRRRLKTLPPIEVRKAHRLRHNRFWRPEAPEGEAYAALCWEATVVEVEIDPLFQVPRCKGIWVSLGAGSIYDSKSAKLETENAISRELVMALMASPERPVYALPRLYNIPTVDISFVEGDVSGLFEGAVALGDQAAVGVAPAFVTAVSQAMGSRFDSAPVIPAMIGDG